MQRKRCSPSFRLVIECTESIPCDPCKDFCIHGAIKKKDLNTPPEVQSRLCKGCGICIAKCPGQAIFLIKNEGDDAWIYLPYEFLPKPKKGEKVTLLGREGESIGEGIIEKIISSPSFDHTLVLMVKAPSSIIKDVRAVKVWKKM